MADETDRTQADELNGVLARPTSAAERAEDADTALLVARAQAGEGDCYGTVYTRYFDRVYAYMKVVLKDRDEAEDAAQQVFTQVLEALPSYEARPDRPFRAWLFVAARNHALERLRKLSRVDVEDPETINRLREAQGEAQEEAPSLGWVTDPDLMILIERLPPSQRQVLAMRFLLGMPSAEIAEALGRTPGAVRMQQSRALGFLRERLLAVQERQKRAEATGKAKMARWPKQARVLRARRWALGPPGPNR